MSYCVLLRLIVFCWRTMNKARVNCPECNKSYANRRDLKRYLIGAHNMCFIPGTGMTRVMTGVVLKDKAKALLRHQQRNRRMRRQERRQTQKHMGSRITHGRIAFLLRL